MVFFVINMTYSKGPIALIREITVVERSRNDRRKIELPAPFDFAQGATFLFLLEKQGIEFLKYIT